MSKALAFSTMLLLEKTLRRGATLLGLAPRSANSRLAETVKRERDW